MALLSKCSKLPFANMEGRCNRCGKKLSGRRKRWCSHECEDFHWANHYWELAKKAVLKRDKNLCVKCGGDGAAAPRFMKVQPTDTATLAHYGIELVEPLLD